MRTLSSILVTAALLSGCTKWGTTVAYGPKYEVERRLLGSPSIATTSSASLSAGFAGVRGRGVAVAGLEAGADSMSRTHCVQQAEITYEQPVEYQPVVRGRTNDVAAAVGLGFVGLGFIVAGLIRSSNTSVFEPGDPFYEEPASGAPLYAIGGVLAGGGVGILAYSFGSLPKGPRPAPTQTKRSWVQQELVEASGCGLPGDVAQPQPQPQPMPQAQPQPPVAQPAVAAPAPTNDTAVRLKKLDQLRASGAITEAEYQKKRKQILDEI